MNDAFRVLFFKNGFEAIDGSAERLVNYALALQRVGHQASVLIANPTSRRNQYLIRLGQHGIKVRYLGQTLAVFRLRSRRILRRLSCIGRPPVGVPNWSDLLKTGLTGILRAGRYDLLHIFVDPAAPLGLRAALRAGIPTLCHEAITPRSAPETYSYYDELAELLPHCTSVAAQSPLIVHEIRQRIPFNGRVAVIPNIVEAPGECPPGPVHRGDEVVFGFAARFERRKAPLSLIEAFAEAVKQGARPRLRMAGDGPLRSQMLERAAQLGIVERCDFLPRYESQYEREAFFGAIQVVVQPSLAEGLPNTVLEGMARGKAIICTRVGGIADILSEDTAVLIPPADVRALASALVLVARDGELRNKLGRAARTIYLKTFSPAVVLPALLSEYQKVIGESLNKFGGSASVL